MSTIKVDTIQKTTGVEVYTAKAWVNINGVGTIAARASGNVSSLTDIGTGQYRLNFTTAFSDTNYTSNVSTRIYTGTNGDYIGEYGDFATQAGKATGSLIVGHSNSTTLADTYYVGVAIYR